MFFPVGRVRRQTSDPESRDQRISCKTNNYDIYQTMCSSQANNKE